MTDDFEAALVSSGMWPDLVGIPLVIQGQEFCPDKHQEAGSNVAVGKFPETSGTRTLARANILENEVENVKGRRDWGPTSDNHSISR